MTETHLSKPEDTKPEVFASKFFHFVSLCLSGKNALLFWLSAFVIFSLLSASGLRHPLWRTADARFIELSRETYLSGNWAVPHLNNEVYLEKPPLFYDATALAFLVTGRVSETVARIPTAICGILGALAAVAIGARLKSRSFGLLLGLILVTTFEYLRRSHSAYLDIHLAAVVNLSLLVFLHLSAPGKKSFSLGWLILFYLLLTLAFYIKGLIGLAVPVLCVVTFLAWTEGWRAVFKLRPILGILLFLLLTLPWHYELWRQGGWDYLKIFYLENHLYRFIQTEESRLGHHEPFYWYFTSTWSYFAPWSLLLVPAAAAFFRREFREWLTAPAWKFLLCWMGPALILFSIASTKRGDYLLPLYGALVGGIAGWMLFRSDPKTAPAWEQLFAGAFGLAIAGGGLVMPVYCYFNGAGRSSLYLLALLVPAAAAVVYAGLRAPRRFWPAVMVNVWILALEGAVFYLPVENKHYEHSAFARQVAELTRDAGRLYSVTPNEGEKGFLNFYTGKFLVDTNAVPDLKARVEKGEPVYVVQIYRSKKQVQNRGASVEQQGVRLEEVLKEEVKPGKFCILWRARSLGRD